MAGLGYGCGAQYFRNAGLSPLESIQALFNGFDGALYINDPATMYQSKGGGAVTAVDDPVAVWVDQSKGGEDAAGPNLAPDATVFTAAGADGASCTITPTGITQVGNSHIYLNFPASSTGYLVELNITANTLTANFEARLGTGAAPNSQYYSAVIPAALGGKKFLLVGPGGAAAMWFKTNETPGSTGNAVTYDSISVRELAGRHAFQSTGTARPLLKQDGGGRYYLNSDGVDDYLQNPFFQMGNSPITVSLAGYSTASPTLGRMIGLGNVTGTGKLYGFTSEVALRVGSGSRVFDEAISAVSPNVVTLSTPASPNTNNTSAFKNGAQLGVTSTSALGINTNIGIGISADADGGGLSATQIYAVFIAKTQLASPQRKAVERYLASLSEVVL